MRQTAIPCCALAFDLLGGEPPAALHPTVWMGRALGVALDRQRTHHRDPMASLLAGTVLMGVGVVVSAREVMLGAGATELLLSIALAFVRPGDLVLLPPHAFGEYERAARICGARTVSVSEPGRAVPRRN